MESERFQQQDKEVAPSENSAAAHHRAQRLSTVGWALFFIWVGVTILLRLDFGLSLLGVGVITLIMQAVRKGSNLSFETFWVIVGALFVIGGIWIQFEPDIPLTPVLLIIAGLLLLLSTAISKRKSG